LQKRIRGLNELYIKTNNFGKISAMADVKVLEELTDHTLTALLLTLTTDVK